MIINDKSVTHNFRGPVVSFLSFEWKDGKSYH